MPCYCYHPACRDSVARGFCFSFLPFPCPTGIILTIMICSVGGKKKKKDQDQCYRGDKDSGPSTGPSSMASKRRNPQTRTILVTNDFFFLALLSPCKPGFIRLKKTPLIVVVVYWTKRSSPGTGYFYARNSICFHSPLRYTHASQSVQNCMV